jgi:ATP-dependent DNA helicase DinG
LLLQDAPEGAVPAAKWFTLQVEGDFIVVRAHASPVLPGNTLKNHLWSAVRGAVLTSATLTSCGHFDFFLRESGLHGDAAVTTLAVASPFDYARQGLLVATETQAEPRDAQAFTAEMVDALLSDLALVEAGALVLFTSREQMRQAVDAMPTAMRAVVLVQNTLPRQQLLAHHRERVAQGLPSIIFGMQSFGEGLDLPGQLCESVFIAKLPFAPPDDPVGEARAEWLRAVGRDPFTELVVPATAIRLAQWTGRAIRTETDKAIVYCYDRRLVGTGYGQRLLQGLPAFTMLRRDVQGREFSVQRPG